MKKEEQRENFRSLLGFKEHDIMKVIEKTTLESLKFIKIKVFKTCC